MKLKGMWGRSHYNIHADKKINDVKYSINLWITKPASRIISIPHPNTTNSVICNSEHVGNVECRMRKNMSVMSSAA